MTMTLETAPTTCLPGFGPEAFEAVLAATRSEAVRARRRAAFESYLALPVPHARMEEYRRTDPARFPFARVEALPLLRAESAAPSGGPEDEEFDVVVDVSESGCAIADRSGALKDGKVTVCGLDEAGESDPETIRALLGGKAQAEPGRKYRDLVDAFWNVGLFVQVGNGIELPQGVLVRYRLRTPGVALLPRLLVDIGRGASATVVESFDGPDGCETLTVASREVYVDAGARCRLISLQEWGDEAVHVAEDWARIHRDATVDLLTMSLGGKLSKVAVGGDVCEPGSHAWMGGLFFGGEDQHFDQRTLQYHSSPDTTSKMLYKGAVSGEAHSVYQGFIQALPGAIRVDAYQTNNNLILSPEARADSIPGLLIDADDLACSHGATIGNLDEDQVFYLRARGLPDAEARKLLVLGFFEEIVERVPYRQVQDRLHKQLERKLALV